VLVTTQLDRPEGERRTDGQFTALRGRPRVGFPLVTLGEPVQHASARERECYFGSESKNLVLPADDDARESFELILA
jgi:hypothetical protein